MDEIAVVIPLYNGSRWIRRTLESVVSQTRPAREIVVVDDGSTDDSREIAASFSAVRLIANSDKGSGSARNLGLHRSDSPLVAFLDQDDVWHPRHLELLGRALDREPAAVAACSLGASIGDDDEPWFDPELNACAQPIDLWSVFPFGLVRCPGLVLSRRNALKAVGGWNTQTTYVADIELWMCMNRLGSFLQLDAETMGVRVHHDSYSGVLRQKRIDRYIEALLRFAERFAENGAAAFVPTDTLARRLRLTRSMVSLAQAFVVEDRRRFRWAIKEMIASIEPEPATFRSQSLHTLLWFLSPDKLPDRKRSLLSDLYALWPRRHNEREILRRAFLAWPASFWIRECLAYPMDYSRCQLLVRSTIRRLLRPESPLVTAGVDADGWTRSKWFIRGDANRSATRIRLRLHLPTWSGLYEQRLTIHSPAARTTRVVLSPGYHSIVIEASEATIEAESHFRLPNESRLRSLQLLSATSQGEVRRNAA
jgi:glycosyltransferase involved in cell wall biosynthesis